MPAERPGIARWLLTALIVAGPWPLAGVLAQGAGVPPQTPWSCPDSYPIKGYLASEGHDFVYFLPDDAFYEEASPDRCYATEEDARRDGGHRPRETSPSRGVVRIAGQVMGGRSGRGS